MSKKCFMMATKAMHKLGDLSSDTPDLCVIYGEDEENYIGSWIYGFGYFDVRFPKSTTRDLSEEDLQCYTGQRVRIGSQPPMYPFTREQLLKERDTAQERAVF